MFKIKKIFNILVSFAIFTLVFASSGTLQAADGTLDQSHEVTSSDGSLAIKSHQRIGQTFKPTMEKLTMVVVYITNAVGTLDLYVRSGEAGTVLTQMFGQAAINGWNSFDITNIDVVPGQTYSIYLNASTTNTQWSYTDSNKYVNGHAYWDSTVDNDKDFGFKTFGIDTTPPAAPADADDTPTGVDTSTNAGASPAANTTTTIKAPTAVRAEKITSDSKTAAKISWTKSVTTNVDGYRVFRKGGEVKDFKQVAQTTSAITNFINSNVTTDIKYTYIVRAYKGTKESVNSNEAEITLAKSSTKKSTSTNGLSIDQINWTDPIYLAFFGLAGVAILGFLLWYLIHRRKKLEAGL